ncbi:ATP-binding protein [Streptomyces prunicolor]|uniref:ATP-binding protein n=1 Tax=Streptomyces prunicolor TaxID=67348 RepID=UPI0033F03768
MAVAPAGFVLLLTVAAGLFVGTADLPPKAVPVLIAGVAASGVIVLVASFHHASTVAGEVEGETRLVAQWLEYLHEQVAAGGEEARQSAVRLQRGQRPFVAAAASDIEGDHPFARLARELSAYRAVVGNAMTQAAGQRVQVFVNFSDRLKSLGNAALAKLDDVERDVEDPDHLAALYSVDHDMTRINRAAESMAVMGGVQSSRHEDPQSVRAVLRLGIQEIHAYARAKVITAPDAHLPGYAVASVTHLLAELLENATAFSNPSTRVDVSASIIPVGLLVEIDDKGVGMDPEILAEMNALLADHESSDAGARLISAGQNGLFVVASLARRYGITVQLRQNMYGGIQAAVVVPHTLLEAGHLEVAELKRRVARRQAAHVPAPRLSAATSATQVSPAAGARSTVAHPSKPAGSVPAPAIPGSSETATLYLVDGGTPGPVGGLRPLPVRPDHPQSPETNPAQTGTDTEHDAPLTDHNWQLADQFSSGWHSASRDEDAGPEQPAPAS